MSTPFSHKIQKAGTDSELLSRLNTIPYPPEQLYILGNYTVQPSVAIIGSRKHSTYGQYVTELFAGELARNGVAIVSGLALGIDSIAHRAALDAKGTTHAVLPTGLKTIYPSTHRQLAINILQCGGSLISEYPPTETKAYKQNFIARNRLVSGLADAVIVVEATERSGTLHTVNFALEQNREVFAIPGPINSPTSAGTNQLIQTGAQLLYSPEQILDYLGVNNHPKENPHLTFENEIQEQIYASLLDGSIVHAEELMSQVSVSVQEFNQALTMLELYGHIKCIGGNQWTKS